MVTRKFRKPYRVKRKKSILKNRFFLFGFLILIIIGIITYFATFASIFQIKEIQISGNQKVQRENLENLIWRKIDRKIFIFPTKSIFLTNFQEIKKNLLETFPKISQINLKRKFPDILILKIQEREPLFVFCKPRSEREISLLRGKNSSPCFYLDKEGVIFEEVSGNGEQFLIIKDVRSQEARLGKKVIEEKLLGDIRKIVLELRETEIFIEEFTLFEEKIEVKTLQDFEVYFNQKEDISSQIQNLSLVLEEEIPLPNRENLEYIDLRFGNRVYYKYRK